MSFRVSLLILMMWIATSLTLSEGLVQRAEVTPSPHRFEPVPVLPRSPEGDPVRLWLDTKQASDYCQSLGGGTFTASQLSLFATDPYGLAAHDTTAVTIPGEGIECYQLWELNEFRQILLYHELGHWALDTQPALARIASHFWRDCLALIVIPGIIAFGLLPWLARQLAHPGWQAVVQIALVAGISWILMWKIPFYADIEELYVSARAYATWNAGAPALLGHDRPGDAEGATIDWAPPSGAERSAFERVDLAFPWFYGTQRALYHLARWIPLVLVLWLACLWTEPTPSLAHSRRLLSLIILGIALHAALPTVSETLVHHLDRTQLRDDELRQFTVPPGGLGYRKTLIEGPFGAPSLNS